MAEEPGAPPPGEPAAPPPSGAEFAIDPGPAPGGDDEDSLGSASWFAQNAFSVSFLGKKLSGAVASKLLHILAVGFVILLVTLVFGGSDDGGGGAGGGGSGAVPSPPPSQCRERAPGGQYTCAQQAEWGKCDTTANPWMRGYCCETCAACADECTSVYGFHVVDADAPPSLLLACETATPRFVALPALLTWEVPLSQTTSTRAAARRCWTRAATTSTSTSRTERHRAQPGAPAVIILARPTGSARASVSWRQLLDLPRSPR